MNKTDLIEIVTDKLYEKYEFENWDIKKSIDLIVSTLRDELSSGKRIEIRGFGSFHLKKWNSCFRRNPKTGETWRANTIKARFIPSKSLSKTML